MVLQGRAENTRNIYSLRMLIWNLIGGVVWVPHIFMESGRLEHASGSLHPASCGPKEDR